MESAHSSQTCPEKRPLIVEMTDQSSMIDRPEVVWR